MRIYARTDPKKRTRRLDPERAVNTLILSKALGLAAAFLLGWYGVQLIIALPHSDAPYYAGAIRECAIAAAVSLIDMIIGIISEWFCQLPPDEGPENPKIKERQRQQRQLARGGVAASVRAASADGECVVSVGRRLVVLPNYVLPQTGYACARFSVTSL